MAQLNITMIHLSNRIAALSESQSLKMAARCRQMRAEGVDVVSMSLGEPDFTTPDHIKQAAVNAVRDNMSYYGPVPGYESLRQAIAHKLLTENNLHYTPNQIIVSVGAKQAICNALLALINPGDEVIIPTPSWVSYSEMVKLAEGTNVFVRTMPENGYKLTAQQLETAITPQTKMLILCSPNNPTGSVYSRNELAALAEVIKRHPGMYVISDEIYEHLNYVSQHESLAQFEAISDRVIIINGVSKAYAMTGYRIGWLAAEQEIVNACKKLQSQSITCACTIAQKTAEAAYTGSQECVENMRKVFNSRRQLLLQLVRAIPEVSVCEPQGAFYLFPDVSAYYGRGWGSPNGRQIITDSNGMAEYLLNEAHVACVAGSAFGEDCCIRLSYATDEGNIREAMSRIAIALNNLG